MGKKVKVTTKCGETFYYNYDQEVDTVEVVETERDLLLRKQEDHWHLETQDGLIVVNINISGREVIMETVLNGGGWSLEVDGREVHTR